MKFEDIKKVNEMLQTTDIKGRNYIEVNQRIKAFRMLYPEGTIKTEMISNENGVCVFRAYIYVNFITTNNETGETTHNNLLLGTGTAYEKENSTFINKTSYIENCETSAVGRALAMCGIGIDTSIASAEEVTNAINQQEQMNKISLQELAELQTLIVETETDIDKVKETYKVEDLADLSNIQYIQIKSVLEKRKK